MSRWLIVLFMLLATAVSAVPAWTWVDENGQVHYSDRPVPGAKQIELPGSSRTARPATPAPARPAQPSQPREEQAPLAYRTFDIVSPVHQQTLWNIGGNLDVQVALDPPLQAGQQIDAYLDGQHLGIGATGMQFTVPDVFRGMHTLQAVIVDADGHEVLKSRSITFMVQQTSIQNPNRAR